MSLDQLKVYEENKAPVHFSRHFSLSLRYFVTVLLRCGSVIVDLALKFSSTVRESKVLSILRDAVKNGEFGDFNVTAITGTRGSGITPTMTTTPTGRSDSKQTSVYFDFVLTGLASYPKYY